MNLYEVVWRLPGEGASMICFDRESERTSIEALRFETFKGIECLFPLGWNTQDQRILLDLVFRQYPKLEAA